MSGRIWISEKVTFLLIMFCFGPADDDSQAQVSRTNSTLNVFLDMGGVADTDYIRQEIPVVRYVRDRELADLHIIMSTHPVGTTGVNYSISFIGYGDYRDKNFHLTYWAPSSNTTYATRKGYTDMIKMGMAPFIAATSQHARMSVAYDMDALFDHENIIYTDPWNYWVFETYGGVDLSMEQTRNSIHVRYGLFADRITRESKTRLRPYGNYVERNFKTDEGTITSTSKRGGFDSYFIQSITDHWGAGVFGDVFISTFHNMRFSAEFMPAIEYSLFPYEEATRRSITVSWKFGAGYYDYVEETIFDKTEEYLFGQALIFSANFHQPWGNMRAGVIGFHHLHNLKSNRSQIFANINLRIFEGLALNLNSRYELINDLVAIPKADLTLEEILLEQRRRATNYQFNLTLGLSYTFGSGVTGVFNPRLTN
jgi:hypothetical protein